MSIKERARLYLIPDGKSSIDVARASDELMARSTSLRERGEMDDSAGHHGGNGAPRYDDVEFYGTPGF